MSRRLDAAAIARLLDAAERRLEGEWILVGGALAAIWFRPERVTEDVDLVSLRGTNDERFALMQLAQELGLPLEAVNSAADYFLRKIPAWRSQLEVLRRRAGFTLYRPTPTLFLELKLRLSEGDLEDCLALIEHARAHGLAIDRARILAALDRLPPTDRAPLLERREALRRALAALEG